ncbi:MAG: efflux RND transporter permease subunit [Pirellulaceae bacterium]
MDNLFYRNPRLLALAIGLIAVAGLSSYYVLPRLEDPVLTERVATVNTRFPGAGADRVESLVTEKIEDELREIEEIKEVRSVSRTGISTITVELRDDIFESAEVWSRVRDKIDDARLEFPTGVLEPDFEIAEVKAYASIVALTWTSDEPVNYAILRRLAESLEDNLRGLRGTDDVELFGDPDEEIAVEIRPEQLAAIGISAEDVAGRLAASDAKVASGAYRGRQGDLLLEVQGELDSIARIAATPIHYGADGRFVRLGDIAEVHKGVAQPARSLALVSGRPAVVLGALVQPSRRIDHWSADLRAALDQFQSQLPRGVGLETVFQQDGYVEARLATLQWNLLIGAAAVIGVIFFLMGWRSALVVGVALPLSGLMVLTGMRVLEIPMHQMSITGLIIALGLLIDNAIVIVDEVQEKLKEGVPPGEAVGASVRHLAIPLLGSTVTTALAFAPIALMPGPAGEFVGSIAVSVILAVFSSLLLALTVIPALSVLGSSLPTRTAQRRWCSAGFSHPALTRSYRSALNFVFRRPALGVAVGLILPVAGFGVSALLDEQFFPPADRDQFQIEVELPAQASLAATIGTAERMRELALRHDRVQRVDFFLGESAPSFYYNVIAKRQGTANYAQALVQIDTAEGARDVIKTLQAEFDGEFPGARVLVRQLEQGPPFDAPIEVRLFGPDLDRLRDLGRQVRGVLAATPEVIHTKADLNETLPELSLRVDEEEARLAGLDHRAIARQLDAALEGAVGGSVLEATEELPVRVRLSSAQRGDWDRIASLDVLPSQADAAGRRSSIPLAALAEVELKPEDAAIPRMNGRRMNEVQAYITTGVLPSQVLGGFQDRLDASDFQLPAGYSLELGGETAKRDDAVGNLMSSVSILLTLMVATLVLSFRSFRMASLIGLVAVLSVGLGLGSLWLFGYPFGFMAIIGTMGLIGVAINDSIVVLAALREDERASRGDPEAVTEVIVRCSRHVIATTLTTMVGFAPLILDGGGFWPPLAVSIAGGVGGATLLALLLIPSAYILVMCRRCPLTSHTESPSLEVDSPRGRETGRPQTEPALAGA